MTSHVYLAYLEGNNGKYFLLICLALRGDNPLKIHFNDIPKVMFARVFIWRVKKNSTDNYAMEINICRLSYLREGISLFLDQNNAIVCEYARWILLLSKLFFYLVVKLKYSGSDKVGWLLLVDSQYSSNMQLKMLTQ